MVERRGDDVPEGETAPFPMAVKCEPDEKVNALDDFAPSKCDTLPRRCAMARMSRRPRTARGLEARAPGKLAPHLSFVRSQVPDWFDQIGIGPA